MRRILSHVVNRVVARASSPYAVIVLALAMLAFDALLWVTHVNATLLLLGSLAISEITLLVLPAILHSTIIGDKATHLKLDALIKALAEVENRYIGSELLTEADLDRLTKEVHELETEES